MGNFPNALGTYKPPTWTSSNNSTRPRCKLAKLPKLLTRPWFDIARSISAKRHGTCGALTNSMNVVDGGRGYRRCQRGRLGCRRPTIAYLKRSFFRLAFPPDWQHQLLVGSIANSHAVLCGPGPQLAAFEVGEQLCLRRFSRWLVRHSKTSWSRKTSINRLT